MIEWPKGPDLVRDLDGLLWKTRYVVEWAAGRPFARVDDGLTRKESGFVAAHHPGPALLHPVDARRGLRANDFAAPARWAAKRKPGA
ncbi:hypothetical protein [Streptomyces axinellae]|uniref:Uncharacterized protein n=1 Tax=Streptomyces axinellae TaxID=552788 RepID=A0ABN3QL19_9ACTN